MSGSVSITSNGINCLQCGVDVSGGNVYSDTASTSEISNVVATTQWVSNYLETLTSLPIGGIIMWTGTTAPNGWSLCDGTNGTPNLSGKFILGYESGTNNLNDVGGSSSVTLSVDEIPAHSHNVTDPGHNHQVELKTESMQNVGGEGESVLRDRKSSNKDTKTNLTGITLQETGGSGSHENMPPYYVLAYIMKISQTV